MEFRAPRSAANRSGSPEPDKKKKKGMMMAVSTSEWIGSAYLFIQCDKIDLPAKYADQKKVLYKALRSALSESTGGCRSSIEILKIHTSDQQLILYLKFCGQEQCRRFLQDYRGWLVHQHIQNKLENCLSLTLVPVFLQLKVGTHKLDVMLEKEEQCLKHINSMKPSYQKDDEFAELDELFLKMTLEPTPQPQSTSPSDSLSQLSQPHTLQSYGNSQLEGSTFHYQGEIFVDRPLTSEQHQLFAKSVGKSWKVVGRSLGKTCRALNDIAIENLAYEYDREGRYEQAYQLLRVFKDSEGKKATLQRLVLALEENGLNGIVHDLLSLNNNGL
ncbi:tumor necrosis factor receptor type 1-associated DEATH domain protein [Rhinophrynus dorsalis]